MRKQSAKLCASALRSLSHGKKKHDIDVLVRSVVGHFGMTGQMRFLTRVERELSNVLFAERGVQNVSVCVASADEKRNRALISAATKHVGHHAEVSIAQDPSLIAGAVITIGDKRYDGSIKNRVTQLKKHLQATS